MKQWHKFLIFQDLFDKHFQSYINRIIFIFINTAIAVIYIFIYFKQIYVRSGNIDQAEQTFREALTLNSKEWSLWVHWAIPALQRKDWDIAIDRLKHAIQLCSKMQSRPVLMMLAQAYRMKGDVCGIFII